jgi:membrane-associated protease RseP (regulator of RpoE activity)
MADSPDLVDDSEGVDMIPRIFSPRWIPIVIALALPAAGLASDEAPDAKPGYLGIRMQEIEGGLAEALGMKEGAGVLVGQVIEGSPASTAGLEQGDIIVKVDGSPVGTPGELRALVQDKGTGDPVSIDVMRDGKSKTIRVTLGEAEEDEAFAPRAFGPMGEHHDEEFGEGFSWTEGKHGYLGVKTQPLSKELAQFFGVQGGEGALVSEVVPDTPASKLGLRAGDVITKVNGVSVDGPGELTDAVRRIDQAKEVDIEWVREKRVRSGKAAIEVREGSMFGPEMRRRWAREMRGLPRRFEQLVTPAPKADADVQAEVDALRNELEALRTELRRLQEK